MRPRRIGKWITSACRTAWVLVPVVLLAAALRLPGLASMPPWEDEVHTWNFARLPWRHIIAAASTEHPPGYPILAHGVYALGLPPWCTRLPALLAGLGEVIIAYAALRRLGSAGAGVVAALFVSCSIYSVYYSQEARGYTCAGALTALSFLLAIQYLQNPSARRLLLVFGASLGSCLFHYAAVTPVAGLIMTLGAFDIVRFTRRQPAKPRPALRGKVLAWLALLIMGSVCLFAIRHRIPTLLEAAFAPSASSIRVNTRFVAEIGARWMGLGSGRGTPLVLLALIGWLHLTRRSWKAGCLVSIWACTPFLVVALVSWNRYFEGRYLYPALLPACLLVAAGLQGIVTLIARVLRHARLETVLHRILLTVSVSGVVALQLSATLEHAHTPRKYLPCGRGSRFGLQYIAFDNHTDPWMVRVKPGVYAGLRLEQVGSLLCPLPQWEETEANNGSRTLGLIRKSRVTDELVVVRIDNPPSSAGLDALEPFATTRSLAATGETVSCIDYANPLTHERTAISQLSWTCRESDTSVQILIFSAREEWVRAYVAAVLREARCHATDGIGR
ncbi:MAG: glycosyltransferase family 39 protein [Planctomycetota bacterium]